MATGYGICVYIVYEYCTIFVRILGDGLIGTNAYGGCVEIVYGNRAISVQSPRSLRKISTELVRRPCGFRAEAPRRSYGNGDGATPASESPGLLSKTGTKPPMGDPSQ